MKMKLYKKVEQLVYIGVWIAVVLAPLLTLWGYAQLSGQPFTWSWVIPIWTMQFGYMVVFFIHNYTIAPLLIYGRKWDKYLLGLICLIAAFFTYEHQVRSHPGPPRIDRPATDKPDEKVMPFDDHGIMHLVTLLLLLGVNVGVKSMFKSKYDRECLEQLQKEKMAQELQYLKYQISPHFFMNTLNNIHALVDINPEQARDTIVDLSKMMRYLLYEGSKDMIPLKADTAFIVNYVKLMRLRYPSSVAITVDIADHLPNTQVPPLLLITFVENAFKHGVSYRQPSFIEITINADDCQLHFHCRNSKAPSASGKSQVGGVGLENAKRRLSLLYGKAHTLTISDNPDTFDVSLSTPIHKSNSTDNRQSKPS